MLALVVTSAFAGYEVGAHITDGETIAEVRASENAGKVVAVNLPDEPKSE